MQTKIEYIKNNLENDNSYEWLGGFNIIVTGKKE